MYQFTGCPCSVCGKTLTDTDDIVVCPDCGAPYHRACYQAQGACVYAGKHGTGFEWTPPASAQPEHKCPNCGAPNPESAQRCSHCGYVFGSEQAAPPPRVDANRQAQQPGGGIRYLQKEKDVWPMDRSLNSIAAQLQNFIATGDAAQASALLHENLDANLRRRTVELYQAQGYCIGMLNIILEAYRVEDPAVLRVEGASPLQQIFQRRNINELEEKLTERLQSEDKALFLNFCNAYGELMGETGLDYLSFFLKENAHDTFLNYLTRLRLEEAKRLMRDTRLSITEISERVGYASANSFTRAFKKIEHVTPTQYRESSVHS